MAEKTVIFQLVLILMCIILVSGDDDPTIDGWKDIEEFGDRGDTHERDSYIERIHNAVRKNVKVQASNMEALKWDINLTSVAQEAADQCEDTKPDPEDMGLTNVGINFFMTAPDNKETPGKQAFQQWTKGKDYYTYETNSCSGDCSEYLEIITATTQDIGCGFSECTNGTIVLCLYKHGMKSADEKPYKAGNWCSECVATDDFCKSGRLCAAHSDFIHTTTQPQPEPEPGNKHDNMNDKDNMNHKDNNSKGESDKSSRYGLPLWCIILICIIALLLIITICAILVHSVRNRNKA